MCNKVSAPVKRSERIIVDARKRNKGRPKQILIQAMRKNMIASNLLTKMVINRIEWTKRILIANSREV